MPSYAVCTQEQVHYQCGHDKDGQFVKCEKHKGKEEERCSARIIQYKVVQQSTHKCRTCLKSG